MTRTWLIILKIICAIQLVVTIYSSLFALIAFILAGDWLDLIDAIAFAFIAALPLRAFIILSNNYPDKIIVGRARKNFNRLFLINVLLISYLLAYVIRDFNSGMQLSKLAGVSIAYFFSFIISTAMLIIHLCILYSLYWLRKQITLNANHKEFDFEEDNGN